VRETTEEKVIRFHKLGWGVKRELVAGGEMYSKGPGDSSAKNPVKGGNILGKLKGNFAKKTLSKRNCGTGSQGSTAEVYSWGKDMKNP